MEATIVATDIRDELSKLYEENKRIFLYPTDRKPPERLIKETAANGDVVLLEEAAFPNVSRLYRIFEFSERINVIPRAGTPVASAFNFVESGVLSIDEAWEAMLK